MHFGKHLYTVALAAALSAAIAASPRDAAAQAMTVQQLYACMLDANPTVREPCIRAGLQAQDPNIRAAGMAAVFRHRNTIVIEFEVPQSVQAIQARIDRGDISDWRHNSITDVLRNTRNLIALTNQNFSFRVDSFDNQSNTIQLTVRDIRFQEGRTEEVMRSNRRGQATISGETLQLAFGFSDGSFTTNCSTSLVIVGATELRGTLSCTAVGGTSGLALVPTAARMRFF